MSILQSTYLINSPKVKANAKNVHGIGLYKHAQAHIDIYAIHWCELHNVCCSPCYTSIIHCFNSPTSQILF